MFKHVLPAAFGLTLLFQAPASGQSPAAAKHDFCVVRVNSTGIDASRTSLHFRGQDPGREVAGQILVQHYKRAGVVAVHIDDLDADACRHAVSHFVAFNQASGNAVLEPPATGLPNLGRVANQAGGALTTVAEEASRLMCQVLPC